MGGAGVGGGVGKGGVGGAGVGDAGVGENGAIPVEHALVSPQYNPGSGHLKLILMILLIAIVPLILLRPAS